MGVAAASQTSDTSVGSESDNLIQTDTDIGLHTRMQAELPGIILLHPANAPSFLSQILVLMTFYVRRVRCDGNDEITRLTKELTMAGMGGKPTPECVSRICGILI